MKVLKAKERHEKIESKRVVDLETDRKVKQEKRKQETNRVKCRKRGLSKDRNKTC